MLTLFAPCLSVYGAEADSHLQNDSSSVDPVGKYIYIPDSLQHAVIELLKGHSKVVDDDMNPDLNEKVVIKGDTLPIVMKDRNLGRFDRGLSNMLYVPKGQWALGLTVSYGEFKSEDLEIFDLLNNIDVNASGFSIHPYLQYYIRNNLAIGLRFGYENLKGNVNSFNVDISDDMNFNLKDIGYNSESYSASCFLSQYVGLSRNGRFGIYNEVELAFASGSSAFKRPYGGNLRKTDTNWMQAEINFSPGVQAFIMKNVSFHVSFGVFGFKFKNQKQYEDGELVGKRFSSNASFRFNIFNINFGIGVNI